MLGPDLAAAVRPVSGPVRALRSLAAALVCVTAAAVGHHEAGGELPLVAVLSVLAGAGAVAWLLAARRVTVGQMLGLLVLCQVAVHLGASGQDMTMSVSMLGAHVVATAVSVLTLARGEGLVFLLAERLGLRLLPVRWTIGALPLTPRLLPVVVERTLHDVRLAHSRSLRGPPLGLS